MKNIIFFIIASLSIFCTSCNKPEKVPAYISVQSFALNTDANEGTNSTKILDVWAYSNDVFLGAFTLPTEIPVLSEGDTKITLFAGIRNNGSNATPTEYFHYVPFTVTKKLVSGKTEIINPVTTYDKSLTFRWIEDFESNVNSFSKNIDQYDSTNVSVTPIDVKYGQKCALLKVDKKYPTMAVTTQTPFDKMPTNSRVYLEMDYKCDVPMVVEFYGLNASSNQQLLDAVIFKEKNEWNKVYINFTKNITNKYASYAYVVTAFLPTDTGGQYTKDKGEVRVDNFKLIYPK